MVGEQAALVADAIVGNEPVLNKPAKTIGTGLAGPGRPPGSANKDTLRARAAIGAFVDHNAERLQHLLDRIEETEGPRAAWQCIMDVVEYHVPKLQRTELTGKDGAPITVAAAPTDPKL